MKPTTTKTSYTSTSSTSFYMWRKIIRHNSIL